MNADFAIGERTFRLAYGDITDLTVDAIVSSDDTHLSMGGGVSAVIWEKAGEMIRRDAQKHAPVAFGSVAVTSAGSLPFKYVFHAAVIDYEDDRFPDEATIRSVTSRCFDIGDQLGISSIAFPAFGTGVGGFPLEQAAEAMTDVIAEALARQSSIELAVLALWPGDVLAADEVRSTFARAASWSAVHVQAALVREAEEQIGSFAGTAKGSPVDTGVEAFRGSIKQVLGQVPMAEQVGSIDGGDDRQAAAHLIIDSGGQAARAAGVAATEGLQREILLTEREALRLLLNSRLAELQTVQGWGSDRPPDGAAERAREEGLGKELEFITAALAEVHDRLLRLKGARPTIEQLLASPESAKLEFKSSARWNIKAERADAAIELEWLKTLAGFMNAAGGTLLIGVADDGSLVGLEVDFQTFQSQKSEPRDAFQNWLVSKLGESIGMDGATLVRTSLERIRDCDVCRLEVEARDQPTYLHPGGDFYVRVVNTTRKLNPPETVNYVQQHWSENWRRLPIAYT